MLAVYPLIANDAYITMSKAEFVGSAMKAANGSLNPTAIANLYQALLDEAGLPTE